MTARDRFRLAYVLWIIGVVLLVLATQLHAGQPARLRPPQIIDSFGRAVCDGSRCYGEAWLTWERVYHDGGADDFPVWYRTYRRAEGAGSIVLIHEGINFVIDEEVRLGGIYHYQVTSVTYGEESRPSKWVTVKVPE